MKHILFLLSRFLDGGIDMVLVDYLRNLAQCPEYDVTLAISTDMGKLEVFRNEVPGNVKVIHLVEEGFLTKWRKRKISGKIPVVCKLYDEIFLAPIRRYIIGKKLRTIATRYDVIVDFDCCHYSYLKNISVWKVAWFHFSFNHRMENDRRRMKRIGNNLSCYDRVVTISKAMYAEGQKLFPWMDGKWRLIYNAKDPSRLMKLAEKEVDDARINEPYILAIERLEESQKDITTLIRAYHILKERYHGPEKLYLLGKGRDEAYLKNLAASLAVEENVIFLGFHSNPYPWIKHAKIIAHSAKMEGLPTAMIESLILGKLIVSSDCPTGPREILHEGKAGILVPVGDAEGMAQAWHRLLTDESLRTSILQDARSHQHLFLFESTRKKFDEVITPDR